MIPVVRDQAIRGAHVGRGSRWPRADSRWPFVVLLSQKRASDAKSSVGGGNEPAQK